MPKKATVKTVPTRAFEEEAESLGACRIAGLDEAGRGPLAGPVVAAAVIFGSGVLVDGVADCKILNPEKRVTICKAVEASAVAIGRAVVPPEVIDEINIYQAARLAMKLAVEQVLPPPDYLLIDGNFGLEIEIAQRSIVGGDGLCHSIAAAGIVAKVTRDRIMTEYHEQFPEYGFAQHKGYGTEAHRLAIREHGPCPIHRKSFNGVKEYYE